MIQLRDVRCKIEMDSRDRILCLSSQNPHCVLGVCTVKCFKTSESV